MRSAVAVLFTLAFAVFAGAAPVPEADPAAAALEPADWKRINVDWKREPEAFDNNADWKREPEAFDNNADWKRTEMKRINVDW